MKTLLIIMAVLFVSCHEDCEMICAENIVYSKMVNGEWKQFKKETKPRKTACDDYSWTESYVNKEGEFVKVYHGVICDAR